MTIAADQGIHPDAGVLPGNAQADGRLRRRFSVQEQDAVLPSQLQLAARIQFFARFPVCQRQFGTMFRCKAYFFMKGFREAIRL